MDSLDGPAGRAGPRRAAGADRVLRHLPRRRHAHRRVDGRVRGRRAEEVPITGASRSARSTPATISPRWRRSSRAATPSGRSSRERSPYDADRDASFAALPEPGRDRRRQGPARRRPRAAAGLPRPRRRRRLAGQADRGGLPARERRAARAAARHARAAAAPARARRGAPLRHHPPPDPPRQGDDGVDHGRAARASARRASARCSSTSARPRRCSAPPARSSRTCRASRRRSLATSTPTSTRRDAEPWRTRCATAIAERPPAGLQPRGPRGHLRAVAAPASRSAMNVFEDAGYFCVDNLPAEMIRSLGELFMHEGSKVERAAVVCDSRGGEYLAALAGVIDQLAAAGVVAPRRLPHRRRGGAGQPLQGDAPPPPARAARQRARRHPRRARAARAGAPARGHRHRHLGPERRGAAPQGRRRAARAGHARQARGHLHVLRPQARPAARRRPRLRRPLPPQPALRPRPAPADRLRPADRRLRRPRRPARGVLLAPRSRCWSSCSRSTSPRARRT